MHRIIGVEVLSDYRIRIRFADNVEGIVDLSDLVGKGVFAGWRDPASFSQAHVDPVTHTVAWPGGIDLCPDSLRQEIAGEKAA